MDSEQACPGTCNRYYREAREAWHQALAGYDPLDASQSRPEPPSIQPWPGDPWWCRACASKIRARLAQLDYLIPVRKATADGHRESAAAERVSGSQASHSPSPAGDDEDEAASMLRGWERAYRDIRGWPPPGPCGELASVETECIAWLMHHLDGILRTDIAIDFGEEILQWHRELTGSAKAGTRKLRKPLRCPRCHLLLLTWTEGDSHVICQNRDCGTYIPLAEYETETERRSAALERGELDTEVA